MPLLAKMKDCVHVMMGMIQGPSAPNRFHAGRMISSLILHGNFSEISLIRDSLFSEENMGAMLAILLRNFEDQGRALEISTILSFLEFLVNLGTSNKISSELFKRLVGHCLQFSDLFIVLNKSISSLSFLFFSLHIFSLFSFSLRFPCLAIARSSSALLLALLKHAKPEQ
jgi:hypothetical protein